MYKLSQLYCCCFLLRFLCVVEEKKKKKKKKKKKVKLFQHFVIRGKLKVHVSKSKVILLEREVIKKKEVVVYVDPHRIETNKAQKQCQTNSNEQIMEDIT